MTQAEYLTAVADSPWWRPCHFCGASFEPLHRTQYHCSADCAARCLARRLGRSA